MEWILTKGLKYSGYLLILQLGSHSYCGEQYPELPLGNHPLSYTPYEISV